MLPDSILPTPEDDIARVLRDYERRLSHLETLEGGGGGFEIGARVFNSANISCPNGANVTLTYDSERYDTDAIHSVLLNTGRLTARTVGKYIIVFGGNWAFNIGGSGSLKIQLNGATSLAEVLNLNPAGNQHRQVVTTIWDMAVGDYVELIARQTSGGPANMLAVGDASPEFMMQKIG